MKKSLFLQPKIPEYLLDLEYRGPSFAGMMEISALRTEIAGLEDAIKIIAQVLVKHKKADFSASDLQIFVEAFEKASFKKRVKIVLKSLKSLNEYQGAIAVGVLLIAIMALVQQRGAAELKDISPQLMSQIRDQTKVELLKDQGFLQAVSDIVRPLEQNGDELFCAVPLHNQVTVRHEDKKEFLELSGEIEEGDVEGDRFELLTGRIHFANLDAVKRHLGFKVNGVGASIPATLSDELIGSTDLKSLLGQWVKLEGISAYQKGLRSHIDIKKYKVIRQQEIEFNNEEQ